MNSLCSSVTIVSKLRVGRPGFDSRQGQGFSSLRHRLQTTSDAHLISYTMGTASSSPGREADHSPPSSAEVTNAWSYTFTPQYAFMARCLDKHRDNFIFTCSENWYDTYTVLSGVVHAANRWLVTAQNRIQSHGTACGTCLCVVALGQYIHKVLQLCATIHHAVHASFSVFIFLLTRG
jgi:hypothetical protein